MAKKENKDLNKFKPSEFLKARRPERYSDSLVIEEPQLTKDILEYHLETLTSRSQEKEFEHFARSLLEKEICPNLRPQTGPTGGGDSKADTETFPVAEEIALRWYQGDASAKERWAFAMSANKKWKDKAKKDVKGIVETKRGYSLIYFVSNQFISDKKRAAAEDDLKKEFRVEVRILDRAWIVERVIKNGHINIAATTLSIPGLQVKPYKRTGPLDAQREIDLKELDEKVSDPTQYAGVSYQLAEDCLRSASLASELERSRNEVDGRFAAALRIAETVKDERQILRIYYRQAWTACFAYDDIAELSRIYDKVEELALKSDHADDVEYIFNLWNVLFSSYKVEQITKEKAKLGDRSKTLRKKLEEIAKQTARPNNAHSALTMLSFHDLTLCLLKRDAPSEVEDALSALNVVIKNSEGLGEYPFESYANIILELGHVFTDSPAYEELFETVNRLMAERSGEGTAGVANLNRGIQKLRADKIYDAIRSFGQAQQQLIKEEHRYDLIKSLLACGDAYKKADLPWAARANILAALSMMLADFRAQGRMPHLALSAAQQFTVIEVTLGRVTPALFGFMLSDFIVSHVELDEEDKKQYTSFKTELDSVFSILLLKADTEQLKHMTKLPHLLEEQQLFISEGSVLFALGHLEKMREYGLFEKGKSDQYIVDFFEQFPVQPANEDLPDRVELFLNSTIHLESNVLGSKVIINTERNPNSILIAETLLSIVEAFFATSLGTEVFPYREKVEVTVKAVDKTKNKFGFDVIAADVSTPIEVVHTDSFSLESKEALFDFRDKAHEFLAFIVPQLVILKDAEVYLTRLAKDENAFGRALTFSDVLTLSRNIFGSVDWFDLSKWPVPEGKEEIALLRQEAWKPKNIVVDNKPAATKKKREKEFIPPNEETLKHTDRKVVTIIDIPLWDKAQWHGVFFMGCPNDSFPPALGLIFKNKAAAEAIFGGWIKRVGRVDEKEEIRIAILTGIDKNNPAHYVVHICANVKALQIERTEECLIMVASRHHRMTPDVTTNLDRFLKSYNKFKIYWLMPGYVDDKGKPQMLDQLSIKKSEISVRPAWQVGEHDEDLVVIHGDDDPIIPAIVQNPPIFAALKRIRAKSQKP